MHSRSDVYDGEVILPCCFAKTSRVVYNDGHSLQCLDSNNECVVSTNSVVFKNTTTEPARTNVHKGLLKQPPC